MMISTRKLSLFFICFAFSCLSACSVQNQLLRSAGDVLALENQSAEEDLDLLLHSSAYHLKLSETLLVKMPDHIKLAESVTRGFTQYAFVFLMDEADRKESESIALASQLRQRAAKMLMRAKLHGLKALELKYPQLLSLQTGQVTSSKKLIAIEDSGLAYWTLTSWAGAISLSKDNPDVVADLPLVLQLAQITWNANPQFDNGSMASMMGTLELARPGGNVDLAEKYFNDAIAWRGNQIGPFISKAENWAFAKQDKAAFTDLLNQAIHSGKSQNDLVTQVMRRRAEWLLTKIDDLF